MSRQTFADAHNIYLGPLDEQQEPPCSRCGAELDWIECETCAGDGVTFEMTEEGWQECNICDGHGGWWGCGTRQH